MSDGSPLPVTLYGISNCDQVKKARNWLTEHGIDYTFCDFKKSALSRALVTNWLSSTEWTTLINHNGTTWRALTDQRRATITDAEQATLLMLQAPSIVKRPVLQHGAHTMVGFDAGLYDSHFTLQSTDTGART